MSSIQLGPYRGVTTVMSTELNALGASTGKAISSALDNSANADLFADFELAVDFVSAPTVDTMVELYLLRSIDGTTYPQGSSSLLPQTNQFVGGFAVAAITAAQVLSVFGVALPPGLFKLIMQNTTNQPFPATGSVLRMNTYQLVSV